MKIDCGDGSDGDVIFDGVSEVPGCVLADGEYTLQRNVNARNMKFMRGYKAIHADGFLLRGSANAFIEPGARSVVGGIY